MRIRAFSALRPAPSVVEQVASLPYDVVTTDEARTLAVDNPLSMLRVVRAEIDLPLGADPYGDDVYAKAQENFLCLKQGGSLIRDPDNCLYLYELEIGDHHQRGLAALCHIDDYNNNLIKKHERTRPQKEDDRTRLTSTLGANPGPVFLTYRGQSAINRLVERVRDRDPLYDFHATDGIRHTVWRIGDGDEWISAFAQVPALYVADGHHRSASAARVGRDRRRSNPDHTGNEDYNWFLCVLFPAEELRILPYNRIVTDLNGLSETEFLNRVKLATGSLQQAGSTPSQPRDVRIYIGGRWYATALPSPKAADAVAGLDISILGQTLLAPVLGIGDQRTDPRIDFIGGIRGEKGLRGPIDSGRAAVAFSLYPVTVGQLLSVADSGKMMPPKSTWFEPKLRSGLFIHTF